MASNPSSGSVSDEYARRGKALTSAVQRLRGWVSSDVSREPELADALVALTGHRLFGHAYAAAAAEAQESVRLAAKLLTLRGPIGPYTNPADAARYVTALIHLATIQVAVGLTEPASRALEAVADLRTQLPRLDDLVDADTPTWSLVARGRIALAGGDAAEAAAYADAALDRVADSGAAGDAERGFLAVDAERLAADVCWAGGRPGESVGHLVAARLAYAAVVGDLLASPARLGPVQLERLAEPYFGLHRDLADRLLIQGDADLALTVRRDQLATLRGVSRRLAEPATTQLAAAVGDLAADLRRLGREAEAELIGPASERERTPPGSHTAARPLGRRAGDARAAAVGRWLAEQRAAAAELEAAERDRAQSALTRLAAERAEAARRATQAQALAADQAAEAERVAAEQQHAAEEAERAETKRRREERLAAYQLEKEREAAERAAAEAANGGVPGR